MERQSQRSVIPLLLTATVDPQGMQGACFLVQERVVMYADALRFYVSKARQLRGDEEQDPCIVFAENSGCIDSVRSSVNSPLIEWVDVSGPCYDQSRGKGYNETLLIHRAITQSAVIQKYGCFMKVTGRLKVLNMESLLNEVRQAGPEAQFRADCKDHKVYEWLRLPINGHVGECRYWFATIQFFEEVMWPYQSRMYDYAEAGVMTIPQYLAEDAMLDVCRVSRSMSGCRDRFYHQARISGKGGHDLGKGLSFFPVLHSVCRSQDWLQHRQLSPTNN